MKILKEPIKIALIYFVIGVFWILLSDRILHVFLSQKEIQDYGYLQTIKGFLFVFVTALLLFILVRKYYISLIVRVLELEKLNEKLSNQKGELKDYTQNLKESEKRFSDLFNICPLPMWVFDKETYNFLDVNIAAIAHYGYSKNEFLSMTIMAIRPQGDAELVKNMMKNFETSEISVYKGVFRHLKKNGELINVRVKSNTIEFMGKTAILVVAHDVTELLQAQQEIKDSYNSIVQIEDQERERFAGELHDSLGQNLIVIKQYLAIIPEEKSIEKKNSMYSILTEVVDDSIKECKELIHDLRPKELYDGGIKDIILSTCDRINQSGDLIISYEIADDVDQILNLNTKFHIFRMFQENINNTMKHSGATTAVVELILRNKNIHFFYSDNGKGIDPKTLNLESSFLSLKRRVISLGGAYDIQSDLGSGMVFYCKIPIIENVN